MRMETNELLKRVRQIEIKTRGLSSNIFAGQYHSAFKGRGMSFAEVREYQYGDDVRDIDWNVTARFDKPFVKVFEEERELTVMLLVDVSNSLDFGTIQQMKKDMVTEFQNIAKNPGLSHKTSTNDFSVGAAGSSGQLAVSSVPANTGDRFISNSHCAEKVPVMATQIGKHIKKDKSSIMAAIRIIFVFCILVFSIPCFPKESDQNKHNSRGHNRSGGNLFKIQFPEPVVVQVLQQVHTLMRIITGNQPCLPKYLKRIEQGHDRDGIGCSPEVWKRNVQK